MCDICRDILLANAAGKPVKYVVDHPVDLGFLVISFENGETAKVHKGTEVSGLPNLYPFVKSWRL